jgi:hypothetical protein
MNKTLEYRKQRIDREKSALSYQAVHNYAIRFRSHFLDFFSSAGKRTAEALTWKNLDFSARWHHVRKLVRHALSFGGSYYSDIDVKFAKSSRKGTLGAANAQEIVIYDNLLCSDNYDRVADVVAHEATHVGQLRGGNNTSLSCDSVRNCYCNYVRPEEDYNYYRINPIEEEAHLTGGIVGKNLTAALCEKQKRQI